MLTASYGRTPRKQAILEQMALHIPNSFVYNLCMYMTEVEQYDGEPVRYAEQALRLMPENMCRKDVEMLLSKKNFLFENFCILKILSIFVQFF